MGCLGRPIAQLIDDFGDVRGAHTVEPLQSELGQQVPLEQIAILLFGTFLPFVSRDELLKGISE